MLPCYQQFLSENCSYTIFIQCIHCVLKMEIHPHSTQTYLPTNTYLSAVARDLFDFFQDNPFKTSLNSWLFSVPSSNMLFFYRCELCSSWFKTEMLCVCVGITFIWLTVKFCVIWILLSLFVWHMALKTA